MNFVHGVFYIAIFSNMAQRQRARYRVARYVIVIEPFSLACTDPYKGIGWEYQSKGPLSKTSPIFTR